MLQTHTAIIALSQVALGLEDQMETSENGPLPSQKSNKKQHFIPGGRQSGGRYWLPSFKTYMLQGQWSLSLINLLIASLTTFLYMNCAWACAFGLCSIEQLRQTLKNFKACSSLLKDGIASPILMRDLKSTFPC